jgi:hypothetical protein
MAERKLIELQIDETTDNYGVEAVSLVKFPAIEEDFIFFSKQGRAMALAAVDEEQRTLIGPALIPDKKIPRLDEPDGEEYDVYFTKDTVKRASELFLQQNRTNEHTFEHQTPIENVSVVESWLVQDPEMDKSKAYGMSVPEGTWMVRVKVNNDDVWSSVKDGEVRGFSIEGYFVDRAVEMAQKEMPLKDMLKAVYDRVVGKRKFYAEISLADGTTVATEADAFALGVKVYTTDAEGNPTDLASGTYTTQAGMEIQVQDNILTKYDGETLDTESTEEVPTEAPETVNLKAEMYNLYMKHYMKTIYKKHYGKED